MSKETENESAEVRNHSKATERRGRWLAPVTLVVAIAALGLAGWSVFRPAPSDTEVTYTDAQRADAKTKICTAFTKVKTGVNVNTNFTPPGGPEDVTGSMAVAANGRVALWDGGLYLNALLNPAIPSDLADSVRKFADALMDIGAGATAGLQNSEPGQAALLKDASAADTSITQLCK
jgi:ABC-type glycerol-3-phosphate transport system substrate-binding protein